MLDCVFLLELGNLLVRLVFMSNALVEHLPWVYLDNITDVMGCCIRMPKNVLPLAHWKLPMA